MSDTVDRECLIRFERSETKTFVCTDVSAKMRAGGGYTLGTWKVCDQTLAVGVYPLGESTQKKNHVDVWFAAPKTDEKIDIWMIGYLTVTTGRAGTHLIRDKLMQLIIRWPHSSATFVDVFPSGDVVDDRFTLEWRFERPLAMVAPDFDSPPRSDSAAVASTSSDRKTTHAPTSVESVPGGQLMWEMALRGEYCDITFDVGGVECMSAHRVVCAARSPWLCTQLPSDSVRHNFGIDGTSARALMVVLEFLYTGRLNEQKEAANLDEILSLAHRLALVDLQQLCAAHVIATLTPDVFVRYWNLVQDFKHADLETQMLQWLSKDRFRAVVKSADASKLSATSITRLALQVLP